MIKAYLANGLFNESDRMYNDFLAKGIRESFPDINLYVPQENHSINDKSKYADSMMIYHADNRLLDETDILIVVLDNIETGAGRLVELGRFTKQDGMVLALYTDTRQQGTNNNQKIEALKTGIAENQFAYLNLYAVGAVKVNGFIFQTSDSLFSYLRHLSEVKEPNIRKVIKGFGGKK